MVELRSNGSTSPEYDNSPEINNRQPPVQQEEELFWRDIPGADVRVFTSEGKGIPAHSSVLGSTSPVLESLVRRRTLKHGSNDVDSKGRPKASVVVPILGVPYDAVVSFLGCIYHNAGYSRSPPSTDTPAAASSATTAKEVSKYGVHLLVLSHAFQVPWLKRASASALAMSLTLDSVVDMLQLARQCDAPGLEIRCMSMIRRNFKEIERTEGWLFVQKNDPWLELEVLERMEEEERSDMRRRKGRKEMGVYAELGDAMECLEHICHQGCDLIGPRCQQLQQGKDKSSSFPSCPWSHMCRGLQQLVLHFAACDRRKSLGVVASGCARCKNMWQLLRLHSVVCDRSAAESCCKVPFCRQFKEKAAAQTTDDKDEVKGSKRWQLLAKKVGSTKVVLNVSKRTTDQRPPLQLNQSETTTMAACCR